MELNIEQMISDSRLAFIQGRYDESLKLAKQAIELDSKSADAYQCAGNAYMSKQDYDTAILQYKKAADCDSQNGDRYFNLAYAYASDNQTIPALEMFARADEIGCSPNVVGQLYKIMAMLDFDLHRYKDAIINFLKAEKIIGIDMDVLQRKALSYSLTGDTVGGIQVANQMKLVAPSDYIGYRIAFNMLLQDERHEDCVNELERAERFADLTADYYFDWLTYDLARFKVENDDKHLHHALEKLQQCLDTMQPNVDEVVDCYVNAAEVYVELQNADMILKCLNSSENPVFSYNNNFSVIELDEIPKIPNGISSQRELDHLVQDVRRKHGDRAIDNIRKEMQRNTDVAQDDDRLTPIPSAVNKPEQYLLDNNTKATYSQEKLDRIYRLYVTAYTIKKETSNIKIYASKLANSPQQQSKYIGKYALVKALKDEENSTAQVEYEGLLKFLRNAMIKDPSDLTALTFRIQCLIDLAQYNEAEKLCNLLSDDLSQPLLEQIKKSKTGDEA